MCDTFSVQSDWSGNNNSFFAKNSDREPGEPQILIAADFDLSEFSKIRTAAEKPDYINSSLTNLEKAIESDIVKKGTSYRAILSSPVWMWGAEIGVNQWGLAIGNEAVFGKGKTEKTALLGMDILRLALHQCKSAEEAVTFISEIVDRFGQGGNGSYSHSLFYDNSFLIQDSRSGWIIETAGKKWCAREINNFASISNTYSLKSDFSRSNITGEGGNLKKSGEKRLLNFLAGGEVRNRFKKTFLKDKENNITLDEVKTLLRSHNSRSNKKKRGMKSICIHNLPPFNSETTASMIVQYIGEKFIIWYTGNSFPCLSLYKPLIFDDDLLGELGIYNREKCLAIHKDRQSLVKGMDKNHKGSVLKHMPERDSLEKTYTDLINSELNNPAKLAAAVEQCHKIEREFNTDSR